MTQEKISDQFQGLPMESLIGGPLTAACNAQVMLANSTATYINTVGFERSGDKLTDDKGFARLRNVKFAFDRPRELPAEGGADDATAMTEQVSLTVPLLSIVPVPNLQVDTVDVTFDMEVKSSEQYKDSSDMALELKASGGGGIGPFSLKVAVHGKVATHKENTRSSDNSAKYHVGVKATNHNMPEGLARVFDILSTSIAPVTKLQKATAFPQPGVFPANSTP
jgi:hypothetical protein